jgi:hypothetical protein
MAVAQSQWAMTAAAQWTAGWRQDPNGDWQWQREGNTMDDSNGSSTIVMGDGDGGTMDGSLP